mgnify:CR=1 FL=1
MPRTTITVQDGGANASLDNLAWTAADQTNGMDYDNSDGKVLVLSRNTNAAARTITANSVSAGPYQRTGNKTISLAAVTGVSTGGPYTPDGFNQSTGKVNIDPSANAVSNDFQIACIRMNLIRPY